MDDNMFTSWLIESAKKAAHRKWKWKYKTEH